jgi:cytochrome P450
MSTTTVPAPTATHSSRDNGVFELVRFFAGPLGYLDGLRDDDRDVIPFTLGSLPVHLVTKPELIVLALENEDWPPLARGRFANVRKWLTDALLLISGPEHHRQRDELWKPLLVDSPIPAIAVERTRRKADSWVEGLPFDVYGELRTHIWGIDWQAWTGTDLESSPDLIGALELGVAAMAWLPLPFGTQRWNWPLPDSRRTREAKAKLDDVIAMMIAERRADPREDMLTKAVKIADADGSITTDEQVRGTFKGWFNADLQYTLLTWTLWLLARNLDAETHFHNELNDVLGDRPATEADVPKLTYTTKLIHEALRLRPPAWSFFRELTSDYRLGDVVIPRGHMLGLSPWFTHRDPRYWDDPQSFNPDRWDSKPANGAYFPFSAGPYECHPRGLVMRESVLMLATLGQRWSYRPAEGEPKPLAGWTLAPKGGARMKPVPRP